MNSGGRACFHRGVPGYIKGMLVAFANTVLVAVFVAVWIDDGNVIEATFIISFMGFFPAMLIGGLLGHYGETMQTTNRRVMLVGMIALSSATVAFLGIIFDLPNLILLSCIPTAAACSVLERWTREKPDETFPAARVA